MFQPLPTPYTSFQTSYGIANAAIPDYVFAPTPLGQGGDSCGTPNSARANSGESLGYGHHANTNVFVSPVFHNSHHLLADIPAANNHNHNHNGQHSSHFQQDTAHRHAQPRNHHSHQHSRRLHRLQMKMEPEQSHLAEQEAAAREYQPQLEGPMVGEKTPSSAITEEYAKAHPTFVTKTLALPQTYSHYRPIQGDGNCGWRAIFFGYFECLIRCGDVAKVQLELERFRVELTTKIMVSGGYDIAVFEDFIDETFSLFNSIIEAMANGQDPTAILVEKFNDIETSAPMVYHLRLLAASSLKEHMDEYRPFIQDLASDADAYCNSWILPVNREIEHLEIALVYRILLAEAFKKPDRLPEQKPALDEGIVLEIAYLDRSDGETVNVHRMPETANGKDMAELGPTIYLLYRPGHYDLLYRDTATPPAPAPAPMPQPPIVPTSLQVNRVSSLSHQYEIQSNAAPSNSSMDMSLLAMIPGFDPAGLSPLTSTATSPLTDGYSPSPQSPWMPPFAPDGLPAPEPPLPKPSPSLSQQPSMQQQAVAPVPVRSHPLRFSKYNFPNIPGMVDASAYSEPSFTTSTFKNSHFNVAHYNNPHFQPEEYRPEDDEEIPTSRIGSRKRSKDHGVGTKKGM